MKPLNLVSSATFRDDRTKFCI